MAVKKYLIRPFELIFYSNRTFHQKHCNKKVKNVVDIVNSSLYVKNVPVLMYLVIWYISNLFRSLFFGHEVNHTISSLLLRIWVSAIECDYYDRNTLIIWLEIGKFTTSNRRVNLFVSLSKPSSENKWQISWEIIHFC